MTALWVRSPRYALDRAARSDSLLRRARNTFLTQHVAWRSNISVGPLQTGDVRVPACTHQG